MCAMHELEPYGERFRKSLHDESWAWARDNIVLAVLMAIGVAMLVWFVSGKLELQVIWLTVVAYAVMFLLYVGTHAVLTPVRLDRVLRQRLNAAETEMEKVKDGTPNLRAIGVSFQENVAIYNAAGKVHGKPTFYHMSVINEPRGLANRDVAKAVAGWVSILQPDGTVACEGKIHRWEHTPGPMLLGRMADLALSQDIPPNRIPVKLDIAMKYDEDVEFYTPTNDTAFKFKDFRDTRYKFGTGEYVVCVQLSGTNVVANLKCKIVNKGKGKLDISLLGN